MTKPGLFYRSNDTMIGLRDDSATFPTHLAKSHPEAALTPTI